MSYDKAAFNRDINYKTEGVISNNPDLTDKVINHCLHPDYPRDSRILPTPFLAHRYGGSANVNGQWMEIYFITPEGPVDSLRQGMGGIQMPAYILKLEEFLQYQADTHFTGSNRGQQYYATAIYNPRTETYSAMIVKVQGNRPVGGNPPRVDEIVYVQDPIVCPSSRSELEEATGWNLAPRSAGNPYERSGLENLWNGLPTPVQWGVFAVGTVAAIGLGYIIARSMGFFSGSRQYINT